MIRHYAIINKKNLISNKLDIFANIIYNNFLSIANESALDHSITSIHRILKSKEVQIFLILIDKKIVSYIVGKIMILNDGRKVLYISYLYTSPKFRKYGFASKLLEISDNVCKQNMLDGVMLTCDSENKTIYNFYLNKGYMPDLILRTHSKYEVMFKN